MPLKNWMTITASTQRNPAIVSGKSGEPVTHLTGVKIMPVMLPDSRRIDSVRKAVGLTGGVVQVFETYTESHDHIDGGTSVTQVPDILAGDMLIVGTKTYKVRTAEVNSVTSSFGETLILALTESRRE